MSLLLSKLGLLLVSVVAFLSFHQEQISQLPTPTPTPEVSLAPGVTHTPAPAPKPTPDINKLVEQITDLGNTIASVSAQATPTPQIVYVPQPTPQIIYVTATPTPIPSTPTPTPTPVPSPTQVPFEIQGTTLFDGKCIDGIKGGGNTASVNVQGSSTLTISRYAPECSLAVWFSDDNQNWVLAGKVEADSPATKSYQFNVSGQYFRASYWGFGDTLIKYNLN